VSRDDSRVHPLQRGAPLFDPFLLMAALFSSVALLSVLESALTSLGIGTTPLATLPWLRVHLVTLGTLIELLFGFLPVVVATYAGQARPQLSWPTWLALNAGLVVLLVGIPVINALLITVGGLLVFTATVLLLIQLNGLTTNREPLAATGRSLPRGRGFYFAGGLYLLLGILVGTGLWLGWSGPLRVADPRDVHIHSNGFGFMALVFAGLLVDLYPSIARRPMAWPGSERLILWMMTIGAFGLVAGPWVNSRPPMLVGVVVHLAATIWLLLNVIVPLLGNRQAWSPGLLHLTTAYIWFLLPIIVAPLILLNLLGLPEGRVELRAPQALTYGWMLQFGIALIPYALSRLVIPSEHPKLGGYAWSVLTVNLGSVLFWAGIFSERYETPLQVAAYVCWAVSLLPILTDSWRVLESARGQTDARAAAAGLPQNAMPP
jgi:cytochrome c oxidase cbb3-type subunit I